MGKGALKFGAAALLVVAAGTVCAWALSKSTPDLTAVAASYTPPALPHATSPSPVVTPVVTPSSKPTPDESDKPRVVFLGDSYTASQGVSDPSLGYPARVATAEGWDVDVVSCYRAGYVVPGSCGSAYAGLIPQVVAAQPSIVVVNGGRYDTPSYEQSSAAASAFFTALSAAVPSAKIYAISPVWDSTHAQHPLGVVQDSVKAGVTAAGGSYLDIGEPLRDHPELIGPDGVTPNADGYGVLADAIEGVLPADAGGNAGAGGK